MEIFIVENPAQASDELFDSLLKKLPDWRRTKALMSRNRTDSINSAVTYLLFCKMLNENYGIKNPPQFALGSHEKPYLKQYPDIFFNISHCRNAAACITADFAVGLDVLDNRKINEAIAPKICTQNELTVFKTVSDKQSYLRYLWSVKEAYSKMTGRGYSEGYTTLEADNFGSKLFFEQRENYCISLYAENEVVKPEIEIIAIENI